MTEMTNTERVEDLFGAFGRGDIPHILDQLTEDVHWVAHLDPSIPWAGDYSGKCNVPQYFQALGSSVEITAHTVSELVADGDTVVAIGDVSFRARATCKESSSSCVYTWKLRQGQVCGFDQFNDPGLAAAFRND